MKKELPWQMEITKADNGYIVTSKVELDACDVPTYRTNHIVVDDNDGEEKAMQRLLWEVLEHFGVYNGVKVLLDEELKAEHKELAKLERKLVVRKKRTALRKARKAEEK